MDGKLMTPSKTIELLTEEYGTWCADQGLKCMDAMELIHEYDLTPNQSTWIADFIERWDGMWHDLDKKYEAMK